MFTKRLGWLSVFTVLAAVGSGLLMAQSPQTVGTWVGVGTADNPFGNGPTVALSDGRTLVVGGAGPDGVATNVVSVFDTATNQFAVAGTLVSARTEHTATLLKDGRVLVAGGTVDGLVSTDIEIFDPSTGASALVAQMAEPRRGHVGALLQNGSVLIAGGYTTENVVLQSAFVFDPATNAVSPTPAGMNSPRASASATSLIDGRVVIIGGTNNGTDDLRSAEIYDPTLQSFTNVSTQLSVPLRGHTAVLLPHNGSVLVAGGTSGGAAQAGADLFLPTQFPDPFSWGVGQFASTAAMNIARSSAIAGPSATEGYAVATGGGSSDVERYRFATIKTDKDDYAPGERAVITGSGWEPNEEVTLLFQEDPAVHEDYELTVTADAQGNIYHDQWAPEEHDLGVRFYLMATGSQSRAQITFTDNRPTSLTVGAQNPTQVNPGNNAVFGITITFTGNGNPCSVSLGITGLPTGATHSFDPDPAASPGGSANATSNLTITTTALTPPGSHNFTVTATKTAGCQAGNPNSVSGNGTLVVADATVATTTTIDAQTITYGQNGTVKVTVSANSGSNTPTGEVTLTVDSAPVTRTLGMDGSYTFTAADISALATPEAGSHPLSASYDPDTGFDVSAATGTLEVDPAPVTATAGGGSGTYNGLTQSPDSCVVSGAYVVGLTCENDPAGVGPDVGTYDIAPIVIGTATNYDITYVHGSYTIDPAALTITADDRTKTYGNAVVFAGTEFTPDGLVNSDSVSSVTLNSTGAPATATVAGSPYDIVPSAALGSGLGNYVITYVNGKLTVDPAALTITANDRTKTYGDTVVFAGTEFTPVGLVNSDTVSSVTLTSTGAAAAATVVGSPYDIVPSAAVGSGLDNYVITYVNGKLKVDPAVLTVTAKSASRPFNTPNPDLSQPLSITGFVLGENASVLTTAPTCGTAATLISPVGQYPVTCGGGAAANYSFTYVNGTLTITAWHLTGFYQPVGIPNSIHTPPGGTLPTSGILNTIKGGQTVPLKFEIFESMGGTERTSVSAVSGFSLTPVICDFSLSEEPIDFTTTGGTSLRYDGIEGQFIQNWQSPKPPAKCYRATMTALDGSSISAFFKTK